MMAWSFVGFVPDTLRFMNNSVLNRLALSVVNWLAKRSRSKLQTRASNSAGAPSPRMHPMGLSPAKIGGQTRIVVNSLAEVLTPHPPGG